MAALRKTAIAVPERLLAELDQAANERGESRNALITRILEAGVRARRNREITRKIEAVFTDPEIANEQVDTAETLDRAGSNFADERW